MCGIFCLIEHNSQRHINNEICEKIEKAFLKGSSRGPEYSHIEQYKKSTPNTSPNKQDVKCPKCDYIIPVRESMLSIILGFHRLAINGLSNDSNQPFEIDGCILICNGEIYNYRELGSENSLTFITESDCEIIIYLYRLYGIEYTLNLLDGEFSFILYDTFLDKVFIARDPFGVRPLYIKKYINNYGTNNNDIGFASEMKCLYDLYEDSPNDIHKISQFPPSHFMTINMTSNKDNIEYSMSKYHDFPCRQMSYLLEDEFISNDMMRYNYKDYNFTDVNRLICLYINNAVKKRVVGTTERPIACLLSGGLDSSLICALVNKYYNNKEDNMNRKLETYSIGLRNSVDLKYARIVAKYLDTDHHEVEISEDDFFNAIPEVIKTIESYDTTTVRASVGNYLIAKYIKENSNAKVIFNGDGADELMGGYLYMGKAPTAAEFDKECRRLLTDIHNFDVLRSDKSVASHGLEPRTPFLDKKWVEFYLTISRNLRCHGLQPEESLRTEKFLIRNAFSKEAPELLPKEVLWRTKEAFSDGVSSYERSWYSIIDEKINALYNNSPDLRNQLNNYNTLSIHNQPMTLEQKYYRYIYDYNYKGTEHLTPYFWLPKYVHATDASARTLKDIYKIQS